MAARLVRQAEHAEYVRMLPSELCLRSFPAFGRLLRCDSAVFREFPELPVAGRYATSAPDAGHYSDPRDADQP
jgi:hypothetical protein